MSVLIVAEHRKGEIRDVTFELLSKGREIVKAMGGDLYAVILGKDVMKLAKSIAEFADKIFVIEDERVENNAEAYVRVLKRLVERISPKLIIMANSSFGLDIAPCLAMELDIPLITDCVGLKFSDDKLIATKSIYGGKVLADYLFDYGKTYFVTLRVGEFKVTYEKGRGEIEVLPSIVKEEVVNKRFIGFIEPEKGEVDITAADIIISIGRGIKEKGNIKITEELANTLGGVLACSRPIVDYNWLPKDRQVGSSGKIVKPKLYLALGISGAFQHIIGMKDSSLIIAINKDPMAPIFRVAHYGVVGDLLKIVPELTRMIKESKGIK